jgi:hypothetical protein
MPEFLSYSLKVLNHQNFSQSYCGTFQRNEYKIEAHDRDLFGHL